MRTIGLWLYSLIIGRRRNDSPCGTLHLIKDSSDPSDGPYFFLELEKDGMDRILQSKTVVFKVDIPRK